MQIAAGSAVSLRGSEEKFAAIIRAFRVYKWRRRRRPIPFCIFETRIPVP